jgi:acyl-CoA reductase-like NAD-dependent aldehyde dehydrogenase
MQEMLDLANGTEFGLSATVWGKEIQKILPLVKKLNAGFVQVNQNLVVRPGLSYGGFKHSGLGKEASLEAMLAHYTRKKTVIMKVG